MPRFSRLAIAMLSSLAVSTIASSAWSSSAAPGCYVGGLPNGTKIPANAPAIILSNNTSPGVTATITADLISTSSGGEGDERVALIGATKDAYGLTILKFPSPPSIGTHTVATKVECSAQWTPSASFENTIVITDPVPLPKTVGTLTLKPQTTPPTGTDDVFLDVAPDLRAFLAVTALSMKLDHLPQTTGADTHSNGTNPDAKTLTFRAPTGTICIENGALHRDKRTVKVSVSAHIAGLEDSAAPAPATLDVSVDCGAIKWTSEEDYPDANGNSGKGGGNGNDNQTTTSGAAASNGADGCSVSARSGSSSSSFGAVLIGALAVLSRLRRRR